MTHSLFANRRRTNKGSFIASQRLLFLDAPPEKRRLCLEPARFRAGRQRKGDQGEPAAIELPPKCRWRRVRDRARFLARLTRPRLCMLVDAGMGKTTAMQQTMYLRGALRPGHLAMGFRFADLPDEAANYLDKGGDSWLPLRLCDMSTGTYEKMTRFQSRTLILRKIRNGEFTLMVDALDQSRSIRDGGRDPHLMVAALASFLQRYPQVQCIVSGRPYSIHRYWDDLFVHEDWDFAQIDFFTPDEQKAYVGAERWEKMQRLEADVIAVPRMLETVLNLSPEELDGVRTGADLYWRALDDSLNEAFANQDIDIQRREAEKLFALIAIEMHQSDNFTGIDSGGFADFLEKVFLKRNQQRTLDGSRSPVSAYSNALILADRVQKLGRVNEVLDFAVLEDSGEQQLFFRDRTLQDFFAALWLSRYATEEDRKLLRDHVHLRGEHGKHLKEAERYPLWKLITEIPVAAWQGPLNPTWVYSISVLFLPAASGRPSVRSTEMMYRAWWGLLEVAKRISSGASEPDMTHATADLQLKVDLAVRAGELNHAPWPFPVRETKRAAEHVLRQFLAEFPAIREGFHQVTNQPRAQAIAREFDAEWFPTEIPPGTFLMGTDGGDESEPPHGAPIKTPFWLAKYPVTNELYALFDPNHATRFDDYRTYSGELRCPAIYINFYDAWCASTWLHGCLPDEYQWERACRGNKAATQRTKWWYGDELARLTNYAWYFENSGSRHHVVDERQENGQLVKQPNDLGLYHLHGNVLEWTCSWYKDDPRQERDRKFVGASRVLRGGSWLAGARNCRCAFRLPGTLGLADSSVGFRVCRRACRS